MAELKAPIIIKKITIEEGGHHGGAWKVAYADFVTAMMAFFLLLWLLSSASEIVKEGIADYFAPTFGLTGSKGIGFEGGTSKGKEGNENSDMSTPGVVTGQAPAGPVPESNDKVTLIEADEEAALFDAAKEEIEKAFSLDPLGKNIQVQVTDDGLEIKVMDSDKRPMFEPGGFVLSEHGKYILGKLSEVIARMPNRIAITGHTDSVHFEGKNGYSNWELSADRANAARRFLVNIGMHRERVGKVLGVADQKLVVPHDPESPRNRHITITLLRGAHMSSNIGSMPAPRSLLSVPSAKPKMSYPKSAPIDKPKPAIQEGIYAPDSASPEQNAVRQKIESITGAPSTGAPTHSDAE